MATVTAIVDQRARLLSAKVKDPKQRERARVALAQSLKPIEQIRRYFDADDLRQTWGRQ
jgi:hypothetical protein